LQRYAELLASGLLTPPEVASGVLNLIADSSDRAGLWSGAPPVLRQSVVAYLAEVGADGVLPGFWIGPGEPDPAKRAAHTAVRREVAAWLMQRRVAVEPARAPDCGGGE
jgi:hypothetical protein